MINQQNLLRLLFSTITVKLRLVMPKTNKKTK